MKLPRGKLPAARLQRRILLLLIVAVVSGALLLIQSIAASKVIAGSFGELEQAASQRSLDQAVQAFEADLHQLAVSARDYAVWDYAYQFVADHDRRFVESNLAPLVLEKMNVDVVWIVDSKGNDVLAIEGDPANPLAPSHPASPQLIQQIGAHLQALLDAGESASLDRVVRTPSGLMSLAAFRVLPTDGRGRARGSLVFGRFLDQDVVKRAALTSQMPVRLYNSEAQVAALPSEARRLWSRSDRTPQRALINTSSTLLTGYQLLRDLDGAPVGVLAVDIPRELSAFGRHTGHSLVAIFSAVIVLFAFAIMALILYLERINAQRTASERRYRAVVTQARETMLLVDSGSRRILEANPAATATLGYPADELANMDIDDLFYACDGDVLKPVYAELHAAASPDRILIVRCANGEFIDVEVTANPLSIDGREVTSFVLRDVSARKRAERLLIHNQDRLAHLAHHDMLTGLLNRLGLERRLPELIGAAARAGRGAAFLYIDLDNFKKINDLHGHACGDKLLQMAAERLRQGVAFDDLIVRMGGDEFVVVASDLHDTAGAAAIAARVRAELAKPFAVDGNHFKITASIGVSVYPAHGEDYDLLLKNADIALYESKEGGRDAVSVFSPEMTRRVTERLAMETELREALQAGQFYLDYQPLIDARTQRIASLEALVRWHHPIRGRVPPLQFIGIAERTGLIYDLGAFVIREACRQIGEWQRAGLRTVPVAVNVSSNQLEHAGTLEVLKRALAQERVAPEMLRIEITESVFMDESDRRIQLLNDIRALGVEVSVDDFGTGYSNLAYLKNLPVDCLKIDRAFVRDLDSAGGADEAIVRAIIRMAETLGLSTVAEGVETPEQARRLSELGADYVQGFYFSPPLAADACGRLLPANAAATLDPLRAAS